MMQTVAVSPPQFSCHPSMINHVRRIFQGEYDLPLTIQKPQILDIGANCGAFTVYAAMRWPGSTIYAYEPIRENYASLVENVAPLQDVADTIIYPVYAAVLGGDFRRRRMWLGQNNPGECSFHDLGEQNLSRPRVKVHVVHAQDLPAGDIIKIDTEGCEVEILEKLDLSRALGVMVEYHRVQDRLRIQEILENTDPIPFKRYSHDQNIPGRLPDPNRGTMKYMRGPS